MRVRNSKVVLLISVLGLVGSGMFAVADAPAASETPEQIRKKIEAVDKQLDDLNLQKEALEKQVREAERLAERRQRLTDLHNESRDRQREIDREMTEIGAQEPTDLPAEKAVREARLKRLREIRGLDGQILAIEEVGQVEQADKLRERIDDLNIEWDILLGPKLQAAANLEGMSRQVKEEGTQAQRDFLERYQKLVDEDGPARQQEFDLIKARQTRERAMGDLINKFWGE